MEVTETKELTIDDLRKITWDYSQEGSIGSYCGEIIRSYLWEVKECADVNPVTITGCNVAEGWVEYFEVENPEGKDIWAALKEVKRDENGDLMKSKLLCKVVIDLLTAEGNVIVTLS